MKKTKILLIAMVLAISAQAQTSVGPSIINSAGGGGAINTATYDFSIGEMTLVSTFTSPNLIVTQGVLQPAAGPNGVSNINILDGKLEIFPNPAEDIVFIQPGLLPGAKIEYKLLDLAGKILMQDAVYLTTGTEKQKMHVAQLPSGNYMLYIIVDEHGKQFSNSYKIQKVH